MVRLKPIAKRLAFALALVVSAYVKEGDALTIAQSVIWLPSGVAVAGLWLLGLGEWWVVALCTITQRVILGYDAGTALPAALGSTSEALLGAYLLRRLRFDPAFARLRDCLALGAAAVAAPVASVLASWAGRRLLWPEGFPFYSGWDGWWRMNALGVLTVVPPAATWLAASAAADRGRSALRDAVASLAAVVAVVTVLDNVPKSQTGVIVLTVLLPLSLYAGLRFGPRGATSAGGLAAIAVAFSATHGFGPFAALAPAERYVSLQTFEFALVGIPLIVGALIAEREVARSRGARSEAQHRSIQLALPDVTYRLRADGTCADLLVPEGADLLIPRESAVGHHIRDFLPSDVVSAMEGVIVRVLSERATVTLDYKLEHEGRVHYREARCVPYAEDEILAVERDITALKVSERAIAFEARVLELVAAASPLDEVFLAIVRGMEELSRGARCSVVLLEGRRFHVAAAPSLPRPFVAAVEGSELDPQVSSCGAAASTGTTVVVADISTHPLWATIREGALSQGVAACWSVPIKDSAGTVLGTFCVYHGTPRAPEPAELALAERSGTLAGIAIERERRSEALRRSEELLATINSNVNEGLFRTVPGRGLVYANHAFARMFGYDSPDEALAGLRELPYADPEKRAEIERTLAARGRVTSEEARLSRRDGAEFWGLVSATAVRGPDGALAACDGAIADVTARKQLEEQYRQAQKMEAVGKLAGGVAHDFNNLLTAIYGDVEAILETAPPPAPAAAHAREIRVAADRAAGLTRQLLAYSRQQVLLPRVLDVAAVVDQLGGMLGRLIGEDIRLVTRHAAEGLRVRADRSQIEQVILNLVVNARDAMPHGGEIVVSTAAVDVDEPTARAHTGLRPGPYALLSVRDVGSGMTPEVCARAFDPFFTTKEPGQGTGLGLATVFGIVQQSGGAVWLDSAPDAGTAAWVYLPRVEAPLEAARPLDPPAGQAARPVTVLVVEDEDVVRGLTRHVLQKEGCVVLEANDGRAALELSNGHAGPIDLLVTDVVMPRLGGRELAQRLIEQRPALRVLFMSGYPNDVEGLMEFAGEVGDFIAKPFAPRQLVERVRALLAAAPPVA